VATSGATAFGGATLVFLGALAAYLALAGISAYMASKSRRAAAAGTGGIYLALLIAIGIGLHNLGEGLAIGSSYAVGALALGTFLVVGFAIHNTTEGLAIVAPLAERPPGLARLAGLGLVAGAPAILGAVIGATAFNSSVAALLLGAGAGAIMQVIQQIAPSVSDGEGRFLNPLSVAGLLAGLTFMYVTSLLISV
jgi:zinc transporter ZupT